MKGKNKTAVLWYGPPVTQSLKRFLSLTTPAPASWATNQPRGHQSQIAKHGKSEH